jgi:hypothetical protein
MIRHASAVVIVLVLNATPLFGQGPGAPAAELIVKTPAADVHKSPTVASPVVGKAPGGTVLAIRRNLGSWVEVSWPDAEAGVAFLHVNTGKIAPRSPAVALTGAEAATAQIAAVAAAATAAGSANADVRAGQPMTMKPAASQPATYLSLPQHRVGMGALMNTSQPGFGVTARTWWKHRLGVQFSASRPQLESADGRLVTSTQLAPSVLYSLPDSVTKSMWLRPYLGAGPRIYRTNLETGFGSEAFGGAEATLAAMPQLTLSADIGYRWARPSFNGFEPQRIGFSLSGHWYVK